MPFDPMSWASVFLGAASLTIQLFDGCIKGFNFLVATVHMPESCEERRLRLIMEYNRLMAWGKSAGLVESETGLPISTSLEASQLEMAAIVSEIRTLLEAFAELNNKYSELKPSKDTEKEAAARDLTSEIPSLVLEYEKEKTKRFLRGTNHVKAAFQGVFDIARNPKYILWTAVDEKAFDALLKRLRELNNRLHQLMGDHQMQDLQANTRKMYTEMVQMRGSIMDLERLMAATVLFTAKNFEGSVGAEQLQDGNDKILRELARLKSLNMPVDPQGSRVRIVDVAIPVNDLLYDAEEALHKWTTATYVPKGAQPKSVWIEWKHYSKEYLKDDPSVEAKIHPGTLQRTAELAALLQLSKPDDFCTPRCLGYFDDHEKSVDRQRFGWVFEIPESVSSNTAPKSLLGLFSALKRPSLTARIGLASRLASCVLYLHAVNWLHKALRSENVIFIYDSDQPNLKEALVSGFEYSRPDVIGTSERPMSDPRWDIYRWPTIQGQSPRDQTSKKTFDIYSLGLVLMEIAHWSPIERILGFENIEKVTEGDCIKVRERLLKSEPQFLIQLQEVVGQKYHDVVLTCLKGYEGFGITLKDDERNPIVGQKIQHQYTELVVQKLKLIEI